MGWMWGSASESMYPTLRGGVELGEKVRARTPQDGARPWVSHSAPLPALYLFPTPWDEEHVKAPAVPPHPRPSPHHQRRA